MLENPYKYKGPLDTKEDKLVCIPRKNEVIKVIKGITKGEYWSILSPRQMGKTTFLRQIEDVLQNVHFIYINFEVLPTDGRGFHQWLMDKFCEEIPANPIKNLDKKIINYTLEFEFFNFLQRFKPKEDHKKIVCLFDEIDGIPNIKSFLSIWRKVYHERSRKRELRKYSLVITGSVDLLSLTVGTTSPFNVTEIHHIEEFSADEVEQLIDNPFAKVGIKVDLKAKKKLISLISGHPQILQHTCNILFEMVVKRKKIINEKDVDWAIDALFKSNTNLEAIKRDILNYKELKDLVSGILKGKKRKYYLYKEFSIAGGGSIVDRNSFCAIRNKIYETILKDFLSISKHETSSTKESESITKNPSKRYDLIKEVGKGGMGTVFKTWDKVLQRVVALKVLNNDVIGNKYSIKSFRTEARTVANLSHTNIVTVYDVGKLNKGHFISMEFIEGENLITLISKGIQFTMSQIRFILIELLKALSYSHKKGVIHRDVKPKNIMINHEGEIKIVDFGLAIIKGTGKEGESSSIRGTFDYISPEQILKEEIDYRADIYSAGVTLFQLVTGHVPFTGDNVLVQHINSPLPSINQFRPETPDSFVEIIEKCMKKNRNDRFQDAEQLLDQIEKIRTDTLDISIIKNEIKSMLTIETDSTVVLTGNLLYKKGN